MNSLEDLDPQHKFWKCSCGDCSRRALKARMILIILFWNLDHLFLLGK